MTAVRTKPPFACTVVTATPFLRSCGANCSSARLRRGSGHCQNVNAVASKLTRAVWCHELLVCGEANFRFPMHDIYETGSFNGEWPARFSRRAEMQQQVLAVSLGPCQGEVLHHWNAEALKKGRLFDLTTFQDRAGWWSIRFG